MKQLLIMVMIQLTTLQMYGQKNGAVDFRRSFRNDSLVLSGLNTLFIQNFINNDTVAHNKIVYKDFLCIASNGKIIERNDYMKGWAHGYDSSVFVSFVKLNESIRLFGDMALIRSETLATIKDKGNIIQKPGLYTDTYVRIDGRWWCVQAQLTSIK